MATHVLDLLLQLRRAALARALEQHVLDEMGDAGRLLVLVPAARVDPHADRSRARGEVRLRGDAQAVGQRGDAGQRRREDGRVVGVGRHGVGVAEEARVRVLEPPEPGVHGLGDAVVRHHGGAHRGRIGGEDAGARGDGRGGLARAPGRRRGDGRAAAHRSG